MTSFLNILPSKSIPAITSVQAPAETANALVAEATPPSQEAKEIFKAQEPVSEVAAPNITEPLVKEVSIWRLLGSIN